MPTFATPAPISVTLSFAVGAVRIRASERADTVVEVAPSDPARQTDVKGAEQARVEYADGRLLVKLPKRHSYFGKPPSVELTIDLPAGSELDATVAMANLRAEGRLGVCRVKLSMGDIGLEEAGPMRLSTGFGDIDIDRARGDVELSTGTGALRIGTIDGPARIKNSNGDTRIGEAGGDLRVNAANGDIAVERALAAVEAKTANGSIRVGEVVRGSVALQTAVGELAIGIREGTAAWLDVSSGFGHVHNELETATGPEPTADTVEVRARTSYGDVVIHRPR